MSIDPIFLDGSDAYQPPVPGTVGAAASGTGKAGAPGVATRFELLTAHPPVIGARLAGLAWRAGPGAREIAEGEVLQSQTMVTGRHFAADPADGVLGDQPVRLI